MTEFSTWIREVFQHATTGAVRRGFGVSGLVAKRHHEQTKQVIDFQVGKRTESDFGYFYVNVATIFTKELFWQVRLEELSPALPHQHMLVRSTDRAVLADGLRHALEPVLDLLDRMGSARNTLTALDEIGWFTSEFQIHFRGQLKLEAGDLIGAQMDFDDDNFDILSRDDVKAKT